MYHLNLWMKSIYRHVDETVHLTTKLVIWYQITDSSHLLADNLEVVLISKINYRLLAN